MTKVIVSYATNSKEILVGERLTFGRTAAVKLPKTNGCNDNHLHGEAFGISVYADYWAVDVQLDHQQVQVFHNATKEPVTVNGGPEVLFRVDIAEVVAEGNEKHRVHLVSHLPKAEGVPALRTGTELAWDGINLSRQDHRVAVVLCRNRLQAVAAHPPTWEEAVAMLRNSGRTEDADLNVAAARKQFSRLVVTAISGPMLTNSRVDVENINVAARTGAVVDWLVRRGGITKKLFDQVSHPLMQPGSTALD